MIKDAEERGLITPGKVGEVCARINIRRRKEHIEEIICIDYKYFVTNFYACLKMGLK